MPNLFATLREALQKNEVKTLGQFNDVITEVDPDNELAKSVAFRSAKSVLKAAIVLGVDYFNQPKTVLEHLNKEAKSGLE